MAGTAPTAADLLAHTDWLTQLARALVGEATAGDVVQETYEVALTQPPRRSGPLRPWLGGVARNVARMTTRGRIRRERREERVAAPGLAIDVPTPEDLVARAEMQQQVARIVLELDEPLRSTILLRFFEGMTAAEIARAQGIPPATVRSRLKDALDRVRATLDQRHGGDRRRWAVLLAPLPVAAAGTHAPVATLVGGLLVKTSGKLVVGLVIVLAIVLGTRWSGLWGGGDPAGAGAGAAGPAVAKPVAAPARAAAGGAEAGAAGAGRGAAPVHDDDPRGTLRLEGQVIDERDQPVAGAAVAIDANPPITVETEADGGFVFEGLIPRDYELEATRGDDYAGPAKLRLVDKAEPVTLRIRRGGAVDVVVVERAGGAPIANADVELRSALTWRARTDAAGVAKLRGVGGVWAPLAVVAPGYSPAAVMLSATGIPGGTQRVTVPLARGAALSGRVLDEAGTPVAGARVVATPASEPFPVVDPRRDGVVAGGDGAYTFPALAAGSWRLSATHGEHAPATSPPLTVDGVAARKGVDLVLGAGGVVRGVVRDGAGRPVASAEVRVVVRGHVEWRARRQAFTGSDGTFAITGLPRRGLDVVAWHATGASAITAADLAAAREQQVALVLDVTGAIEGVVVDKSGAPLGDAPVIAIPEATGSVADRATWSVRGYQRVVTDQRGAFRFAGLPDGAYAVRAARPGAGDAGLAQGPSVAAKPGGAPLRVVVAGDGRIVGKLAFGDGAPPAAFTVAIGRAHPVPFLGGDGSFALASGEGMQSLVLAGPGFVRRTVADVSVTEGKDTDLGVLTVVKGRSISGRVLDAHGAPVAGAKVAAGSQLSGGGSELYIKDESVNAKDTETDELGRYALEGFPPTQVTVVAGKDGAGRSESMRVPAGPDSAVVDLVLAPTAGLEGRITRSGAPVADTIVIASPLGAINSNFFVQTGPDGSYVLDALAPGAYLVYPMLGGGGGRPKDMYVRRVEVTLGTRARGDIDASPGPVTLAVTVKAEPTGAAVPMAQVIAMQTVIDAQTMDELRDGTRLPAIGGGEVIPTYIRMAKDGAAQLEGMRPGMHTVCAAAFVPPGASSGEDPMKAKLACKPVTLDARPQQKLELVVVVGGNTK